MTEFEFFKKHPNLYRFWDILKSILIVGGAAFVATMFFDFLARIFGDFGQ